MSSEDANDYLNEMSQVNSFNANEFRIMSVSMEKVVNQIQSVSTFKYLMTFVVVLVFFLYCIDLHRDLTI